jgi:RND superfamily putative drug exporter
MVRSHPRRVLAITLILAVVAGVVGSSAPSHLEPYAPVPPPGTNSARASAKFSAASGVDPNGGLIALFDVGAPVARIRRILAADPTIAAVEAPPTVRVAAAVSNNGRQQYLVASYRAGVSLYDQQQAARRLIRRLKPLGVQVGGSGAVWAQGNEVTESDFRRAELISFPLLLALSLWFFRGGVAALLAGAFGGLAIVSGLFVLRVVASLTFVSIFALNIITALGVGLAFDYCMLLINRFREELGRGCTTAEALDATMRTAGRTVLLSALTIAASLSSMVVFPDKILSSMGVAGAAVTLAACALALGVLPAALHLIGDRVNGLSPAWLRGRAERESRPDHEGAWYRLARMVTRRPVTFAIAATLVLVALALPALRLNLTQGDPELVPKGLSGHDVNAVVRTHFTPAFATTPIVIVASAPPDRDVRRFAVGLTRLDGVVAVTPPRRLGRSVSVIDVVADAPPFSRRSKDLVARIRAASSPVAFAVTGETAILTDASASMIGHLPVALGIALAVTLLSLFLLTQSVILPLKAVIMNLLSISATLGLMVLVFQDGHLEGLLGYQSQGGLILVIPPFIAALSLGLGTDYGIFVLSRIKEQIDLGACNEDAIAVGLERTGRVVTAAALLFAVAVGANVTSHMLPAKEAGLGMVAAVLIDAMIVRSFLVPSLMVLLGRANWWAPNALRRLLTAPRRTVRAGMQRIARQ